MLIIRDTIFVDSDGNDIFGEPKAKVMTLRMKVSMTSSDGILLWYERKSGQSLKNFVTIILVDGKVSNQKESRKL